MLCPAAHLAPAATSPAVVSPEHSTLSPAPLHTGGLHLDQKWCLELSLLSEEHLLFATGHILSLGHPAMNEPAPGQGGAFTRFPPEWKGHKHMETNRTCVLSGVPQGTHLLLHAPGAILCFISGRQR